MATTCAATRRADSWTEQRLDEDGAASIVIGVVVGVRDVGDVVHEAGDRELGIVRMLVGEDRSALECVGEPVERGLVAHERPAREQGHQI